MFFYRIENKDGLGVYQSNTGNIAASYSENNNDKQRKPSFLFDHFKNETPEMTEWYFGFPTLDDLYSWFNTFEAISYIKFHNCRIVKYCIQKNKTIIAENQLIFKQKDADFIEFVDFDYDKTQFRNRSIYSDHFFIDSNFKSFMRKEETEYFNLKRYGTKHEPREKNYDYYNCY